MVTTEYNRQLTSPFVEGSGSSNSVSQPTSNMKSDRLCAVQCDLRFAAALRYRKFAVGWVFTGVSDRTIDVVDAYSDNPHGSEAAKLARLSPAGNRRREIKYLEDF